MKTRHSVMLALGAALSLAARAGTPFYRVPITVAADALAAGTALTNFPVLVRISQERMPGFGYSSSMSPDAEVVFSSDPGGAYPLSFEIDTWNAGGESLVWQWDDLMVQVTATADEGGSVALAQGGTSRLFAVNDVAVVTAMPGAGSGFHKWTGDVPEAQQFDNPLYLNVGETPLHITAVFSTGRYVTPEGAGAKTGESWENAFASLQDAIDASATGGTIYLATGVHTNAQSSTNEFSLCVITNQSWLAIRGGYAGTGTPGPRGGETVLHNAPGSLRRLLRARNIDLRLDGIVFDGGRISGDHGGGLYLQNSTLAMTNCTIRDCRVTRKYEGRGGGLYLATGSLRLADCAIIGNRLEFTAHSFYYSYGGGIAITGAVTTDVARCTFDNNWIYTPYRIAQGGAIHVSGGIADIRDSLFTTNYVHIDKNYSDGRAWGAAVCAVNMTRLNIADCRLIDNLAHGMTAGGAIFLGASNYIGPTSKGTGIVERCAITAPSVAAIKRPYTGAVNTRDLYAGIGVGAGYLFMTNVVIASDARGAMLRIQGGSTELSRCTLVGGGGYAAYVSSGNLKLTRCIVDDFASGLFTIDGGFFDADYSCIPSLEGVTGLGNTTDAPLLSTDGYYHALSRAGYYDGGFFGGGAWRYDATATSPSIDMAPLSDPYALEPQPNGHRANVGYDAGLPVASRSDLGEPPVASALAVYAYPPVDVEAVTAVARGEVGGPEGVETSADVTLVWGPADAGTASVDDWASKCSLGTHINWELFAEMISNAGANTYYRFYAENADGSAWSEPVVSYASVRLPVVTGESVTHITRHEATANWTLADDGDRETAVSFLYWKDGSTVTSTVPYGVCAEGVALSRIWELEAETTYGWLLEATNVAGTVRTAPATFTTHSTAPAVRYVTPAGAGICDGSDWANAFSNLQEAVDFCRYQGDVIYMQEGLYAMSHPDINDVNHCHITNRPGLAICGRYAGEGSPGERVESRTVLQRDPARPRRIINASGSTIHFDGIDIEGGTASANHFSGFGLNLNSCSVTAVDCRFVNNIYYGGGGTFEGGAVYARYGSIAFTNCVFTNNGLVFGGDNTTSRGGGIFASGATSVSVADCVFDRNVLESPYQHSEGGAICLKSCNAAVVVDSQFYTNRVSKSTTHPYSCMAYGGAIFSEGVGLLDIRNCHFAGNYGIGNLGIGGLMHLKTSKAVMNRCSLIWSGHTVTNATLGSVALISGSLYATNVLQAATTRGAGFDIRGGAAELVNVTAANCSQGYGVYVSGGTCSLKNSIIRGNTFGGVAVGGTGAATATYTCLQEDLEGEGNMVEDPLFVDGTYFHVFSRAGYYTGGWFKPTGAWSTARVPGITKGVSPAIDAGPRGWPLGDEPEPRGRRINLGAYGGTPTASKTCFDGTMLYLR